MVERLSIDFQMMRTYDDPNGPFVRHSDYADLERQIAGLRAELATANADRCFHTDDDPGCKLESTFMRMVDAGRAENTRLRALPLKDEVERVIDLLIVTVGNLLRGPKDAIPVSAETVLEPARALLSRLRAGAQEGWRRECATDGCSKRATVHFERGGVGSHYCHDCYMRVQALAPSPEAKGGPRP